ncbi:hypothetical protein ABZT27_33655 [Streptomyces sp. NPDC005389]|uniref:hypothetical protein n=1 Tax=Streptomyces sp. NPDC005389 TaxID=3157040 RepID=UPI0033A851EA
MTDVRGGSSSLPAATRGAKARIDCVGATVLAVIAGGLVLVTSFGGRWGSSAVVGPIVSTITLATLLVSASPCTATTAGQGQGNRQAAA